MHYVLVNSRVYEVTKDGLYELTTRKCLNAEDYEYNLNVSNINSYYLTALLPTHILVKSDSWINLYTGNVFSHKFKHYMGTYRDSIYYNTNKNIYAVNIWDNKVSKTWELNGSIPLWGSYFNIKIFENDEALIFSNESIIHIFKNKKDHTTLEGVSLIYIDDQYILVQYSKIYDYEKRYRVYSIKEPYNVVYEYVLPSNINSIINYDGGFIGAYAHYLVLYNIWGKILDIVQDSRDDLAIKLLTVENNKFIYKGN